MKRIKIKKANLLTFKTRDRLVRSFTSTTPRTVSPSRYAVFEKVKTATLTPSLVTSYETFLNHQFSPLSYEEGFF